MRTNKLIAAIRAEADSYRNGDPSRDFLIDLIMKNAEAEATASYEKFTKALSCIVAPVAPGNSIPAKAPERALSRTEHRRHYRKGGEVPNAILLVLEATGEIMRTKDISREIERQQLVENTHNLEASVAATLHRESKLYDDPRIIRVGTGRWALKEWDRKDGEA